MEGLEGLSPTRARVWVMKLRTLHTLHWASSPGGIVEGLEGLRVNRPHAYARSCEPSTPSTSLGAAPVPDAIAAAFDRFEVRVAARLGHAREDLDRLLPVCQDATVEVAR